MDKRHSSAGPIIAFFVLAALSLPVAYAAGYLWAGDTHILLMPILRDSSEECQMVVRVFPHEWEATLFSPAGRIEELLTGKAVLVMARIHGGVI